MLQQTRVEAVKPYFERFMKALPDIGALACFINAGRFAIRQGDWDRTVQRHGVRPHQTVKGQDLHPRPGRFAQGVRKFRMGGPVGGEVRRMAKRPALMKHLEKT